MLTAIIMAGGSGERFWPLSTPEKPKQLLRIFSDKTMIRETVDRILPIIEAKNIFVTTNIIQAKEIEKELPDIPIENIIIEPEFKDTAAAIGYASLIIEKRFRDKLSPEEKIEVIVLASDHLIKKEEKFREVILRGVKEVKENNVILTFGITPTSPETGYGYIELKESEIKLDEVYKVNRFREKPNQTLAEEYLNSGNYLWNSGIFMFTTETIFKNFEVLMEEHSQILKNISLKLRDNDYFGEKLSDEIRDEFEKFEKISIDFGIMEHSKNIRVIPVDIDWNDVGSFNAFEKILKKDNNYNIIIDSKVKVFEAKNNIILTDGTEVCLLGVNNLIIVKDKNKLLITKKDRIQEIKKVLKGGVK